MLQCAYGVSFVGKIKNFLNRNKRYEMHRTEEGFNILVETPASKARTEKSRFLISLFFTVISTIASVVAAVFAILAYIKA